MSLVSIFGNIGSQLGKSLTDNQLGAKLGRLAGSMLAKKLQDDMAGNEYHISHEGKKLEEINIQTARYGREIPIIFGNVKLAGNIIWASGLKEWQETINTSWQKGKSNYNKTSTEYNYTISLAIAICEGPIDYIENIWIDKQPLILSDLNIKIYNGTEEQQPDPTIIAKEGTNKTPAFKGLAYVVIKDFPVNNRTKIPNFTFSVRKNLPSPEQDNLENMLTAVCLQPSCGEFFYDTKIQYKIDHQQTAINQHNNQKDTYALASLNNLQMTLPNVVWLAPSVSWFATDTESSKADIIPGVEYKDVNTRTSPEQWKVGNWQRENAHLITQRNSKPIFGGTTNDQAIKRYLQEAKRRRFKIMLHPQLLVDNTNRDWQTNIYAKTTADIQRFFHGQNGYNKFIMHYANLTKDYVDAFLIGSDLINLSKFKTNDNQFPTIDALIDLARKVREIVGPKVKISYAANWGEYHHTDGGWYNLDKLWASDAIDFVGINAYFPLTTGQNTPHNITEVMQGWNSGEGYDYYLDHNNVKQKLDTPYAWKNLDWWWQNQHKNPDGKNSPWQPKSKKIWFTEFGFASVDCATNQPHIFPDIYDRKIPLPKYSKQKVDFAAQRIGLTATLKRWRYSDMVENKFAFSWDVRPYPDWPLRNKEFADGRNWRLSHSLQGKLGVITLGSIVKDLCCKVALDNHKINLNQEIHGFYILKSTSARQVLKNLLSLYDFSVSEREDKVCFNEHNQLPKAQISISNLIIKINNKKLTQPLILEKDPDDQLPEKIYFEYLRNEHAFASSNTYVKQPNHNSQIVRKIALPIVLSAGGAITTISKKLHTINFEKFYYKFYLPLYYVFLAPGDIIELNYMQQKHIVRILHMSIHKQMYIKIKAVLNCTAV